LNYNPLGKTDVLVSELCLGSMTWGSQNSEKEGHEQLDFAFDQGINFIDTAELYPTVPIAAGTQGRTEEIIGSWLKNNNRDKVILASKVCGRGTKWIQNGVQISAKKIENSINGSLKRLQTDYIDLYQLHWPNRQTYHFRQSWEYNPSQQHKQPDYQIQQNILDVLEKIGELVSVGKIKHFGLSNETCWGTLQYTRIAAQHNLPRPVSIQNEYSLMHRLYDNDFAEVTHYENIGLLAFTPLAAGMLTGKYAKGVIPEGSRRAVQADLSGRYSEYSLPALEAYLNIAKKHQLEPAQMALAFCRSRPFMTSTIIGATSIAQLKSNIESVAIELSDSALQDINAVHRQYPVPM